MSQEASLAPAPRLLPHRLAPQAAIERRFKLSGRVIGDLLLLAEGGLVGLTNLLCNLLYWDIVLQSEPDVALLVTKAAALALGFVAIKGVLIRRRLVGLARFGESFTASAKAIALIAVLLLVVLFLFKSSAEVSRAAFTLWLAAAFVVTAFGDAVIVWIVRTLQASLDLPLERRVALLGTPALMGEAEELLRSRDSEARLTMIEVDDAGSAAPAATAAALARACGLAWQQEVDEIVLALPWQRHDLILQAVDGLASFAIDVSLYPDRLGPALAALGPTSRDSSPFIPLVRQRMTHWNALAKQVIDRVGALLALVLVAPLLLLVAVAIKLESPGPVFYRQRRHGFNHHVFQVWKFRSMRHDGPGEGVFRQATADDSRVTRVGRIIRKTSIDELPQLFNVLLGDMSLVGPRPHPVPLNEQFAERITLYGARHRVLPGITGLAQIMGYRGETDTDEKMQRRIEFDLRYIREWSLSLDLRILFMTVWKGFVHPNAF
jgi:putative colanic acid biosynthesis UDP-glucose lipid carrier transferase